MLVVRLPPFSLWERSPQDVGSEGQGEAGPQRRMRLPPLWGKVARRAGWGVPGARDHGKLNTRGLVMASDHDHADDAGLEPEERIMVVLDAYLQAVESGQSLDRTEWLAQYPDLALELTRFLDEQDRLMRLTEPLRPIAEAASLDGLLPDDMLGVNGDGTRRAGSRERGEPSPIREFGDYLLIEPIAHGGMGTVFKARHRSLNRLVALKMVRGGALAAGENLQRFRQEAEAVAHLDHPCIVPIYDVGEHDGFTYFSMKLADGGSMAQRIADYPADPRLAAKLLAAVALAVHHAHQRGILHRDLKPSNILLDEQGQPYVSDFGLAKRLEEQSELTQSGAIVGTPSYMAPEQATGKRGGVTTAADVYGLGAVLYAMLTGRPPFQGDSALQTIENVKESEPDPPSGVNRRVDRDLETICLKCLEKEPECRYASALALAEDLERWLRGEPITARRVGRAEHAWRWCRCNPRAAAMLAAMSLLALFATVGFVIALNARDAVAQVNRDLRERQNLLRRKEYMADIRQASKLIEFNKVAEAADLLSKHRRAPKAEDPRGFEWYYLWRLCHVGRRTLRGHQGDVYHAEFSPNGEVLATCGQDRTIRLWDVATGETRRVLAGHLHEVNSVTFSPDGRTLASASEDQSVKLWDTATGDERQTLSGHRAEVVSALFTPDGHRLVSLDRDGHVILWDPATGREQSSFHVRKNFNEAMAISHDGKTLAVSGQGAGLWELETGRERFTLHTDSKQVFGLYFRQYGKNLVTTDGTRVRRWVVEDGQLDGEYPTHGTTLYSLVHSADDLWMVWVDDRGRVEIFNGVHGYSGRIFTGQDRVWCAAFAPDCTTLATASRDGTVKLWDTARDKDRQVIAVGPRDKVQSFAYSPDGRTLAAAGSTGTVWTLDPIRLTELSAQQFPVPGRMLRADLSRDATTLATLGVDKSCQVWDVKNGRRILDVEKATRGDIVRLSHDGKWLSAAGADEQGSPSVRIWNTATGHESRISVPVPVVAWTFSPDRHTLALSLSSTGLPLFADLASGQTRSAIGIGHVRGIEALEFSADGKTLATSGLDRTVKSWDVETLGERGRVLVLQTEPVALSFDPTGRTLVCLERPSPNDEQHLSVWDIASREPGLGLGPNPRVQYKVYDAQFSPDGSALATRVLGHNQEQYSIQLWPAPRDD